MSAESATTYISDFDLHLFNEGSHRRLYDRMGAHITEMRGKKGVHFAVWAPQARAVSVIGDFNAWDAKKTPMSSLSNSGVWATFVPGLEAGCIYKFHIESELLSLPAQKSDPFAFATEMRPRTASVVYDLDHYAWGDSAWLSKRKKQEHLTGPVSIYEVHLGSWMRVPEEGNRFMTYRELAEKLTRYVKDMGYTHIELMPITEHPLDASWGYQVTGFFAPTSRFGTPDDFRYLIDTLHQNDIGVILDWVPSHFPRDGHALGLFDGSHAYEHADPRLGEHKDWDTYIFNYGRYEVSNFLISNALFWLDKYHLDGLRVDAVASMLYRDYARKDGEWLPNQYGGNESLEAIDFLRKLNEIIYAEYPHTMTIAEESTAWPHVSRPTYVGGLGFGFKWDMGWMHDTLEYMQSDPVYRKFHHNKLTFRAIYQYSENFVLPLSHDEVVYGKRSLLSKMPGDDWQKFANLRLLYGYMYSLPGKKLLFMGGDIGQWNEWYFEQSLDWHVLDNPFNKGLQNYCRDLNTQYKEIPALHAGDCQTWGFEWVDCQDVEQSVLIFLRKTKSDDPVLVCCNFTPVPRYDYLVGVPRDGYWKEIINSDATAYGGSGLGNFGGVTSRPVSIHGRPHSLTITLPPLSIIVFKPEQT
jgi:1,4-alpha-glucan branching enzyme